MSERWKPECLETYWSIIDTTPMQFVWQGIPLDITRWEAGNVFKTHDEALIASINIKSLLLSLHYNGTSTANDETLKNKPLPKLTTEVFDRPDCPAWAKYAAVDACGTVRFFSWKPWRGASCWNWTQGEVVQLFGVKFDATDWENIMLERPKKKTLPEWCKVGEWVCYPKQASFKKKYGKIQKISKDSSGIFLSIKSANDSVVFNSKDILPARIRPWTFEEAPFMIKCKKNDSRHPFAVATLSYDGTFYTMPNCCLNSTIPLSDIAQHYTQSNGSPCGIFQHLENGKWIE